MLMDLQLMVAVLHAHCCIEICLDLCLCESIASKITA